MKFNLNIYKTALTILIGSTLAITSCKKSLEYESFGTFAETFPSNDKEAAAAVNYCYTGMMQSTQWVLDWNALGGQDLITTDEMDCNWGWESLKSLNFNADMTLVTQGYNFYIKLISQITVYIDKIEKLNIVNTDLKARYIAELKGLRGYYGSILLNRFGPVPMRINAEEVNNPSAPIRPRPTVEEMVTQIESDLTEAANALPEKFTGGDYGRFSKSAAITCRMKLYMQQKRWADAVADGEAIQKMGFALIPNYNDNFSPKAKGGNSEIILPIVCAPDPQATYANMWFAYNMPGDYMDASGKAIEQWNGFRMPWKTYEKFDAVNDQRTLRLLRYYPSSARGNGTTVWRDALTGDTATNLIGGKQTPEGMLFGGATMQNRGKYAPTGTERGLSAMKYALDPASTNSMYLNMDYIIYRYADVLLLLAEAYNNTNNTDKAIPLINEVRKRAGLTNTPAKDKTSVQAALEDERLFELFFEWKRKDDLIRWGKYIQRAVDDGSSKLNPNWNTNGGPNKYLLYPIPRSVITQSNGVIEQNPGY